MGMIGGSLDAFIGAVHRKAAALDGEIELVGGAFSSDPKKSKATGEALYLNPHRVYGSYAEMIEKREEPPGRSAYGLRLYSNSQSRALRAGQDGALRGLPRDHRQAAGILGYRSQSVEKKSSRKQGLFWPLPIPTPATRW